MKCVDAASPVAAASERNEWMESGLVRRGCGGGRGVGYKEILNWADGKLIGEFLRVRHFNVVRIT